MPNGWCPGVPQAPCADFGTPIVPVAGVVHDTIGTWPGDRDYVQANSLAHFTIGPDEGQWAQHAPITVFLPHCNGANRKALGIEFSALTAGQALTDWQKRAWRTIRRWAEDEFGIPDTYLDPASVPFASVHVNDGTFRGWISHASVQTDDGSAQHTDYVAAIDFAPPAPTVISKGLDMYLISDPRNPGDKYVVGEAGARHIKSVEEYDWLKAGEPFGGAVKELPKVSQAWFDSLPKIG